MTDQATEICPACLGEKRVMVFIDYADGRGLHQMQDCSLCAGFGTVHPSLAAKVREVVTLRADRLARGMTLRQEASRLGISAKELSDRESGRA